MGATCTLANVSQALSKGTPSPDAELGESLSSWKCLHSRFTSCGEIADLPDIVPGAQNILCTRVLQVILRSYGLYAGPFDGIYDVGTQNAVRRYQSSSGLGVDAQVGRRTWGNPQASFCRNWG